MYNDKIASFVTTEILYNMSKDALYEHEVQCKLQKDNCKEK